MAKVKVDADFTAPYSPSILYPAEGGNMHCFTAPLLFYNYFSYLLTIVFSVLIDGLFHVLSQIFDSDVSFSQDIIDEIRDKLAGWFIEHALK